jgi:hypothetical protein
VVDIDFNHEEFYTAIVDYFELTPGPIAEAHVASLLAWWNKCVIADSHLSFADCLHIQEGFWSCWRSTTTNPTAPNGLVGFYPCCTAKGS